MVTGCSQDISASIALLGLSCPAAHCGWWGLQLGVMVGCLPWKQINLVLLSLYIPYICLIVWIRLRVLVSILWLFSIKWRPPTRQGMCSVLLSRETWMLKHSLPCGKRSINIDWRSEPHLTDLWCLRQAVLPTWIIPFSWICASLSSPQFWNVISHEYGLSFWNGC